MGKHQRDLICSAAGGETQRFLLTFVHHRFSFVFSFSSDLSFFFFLILLFCFFFFFFYFEQRRRRRWRRSQLTDGITRNF